jgi:hypothetical protein
MRYDATMVRSPRGSTTSAAISRDHVPIGLDYVDLVVAFERELGRWDPAVGASFVRQNAPWAEVEREVQRLAGPHGGTVQSTTRVVIR